jgi:dipeptidyl-peptidase 4
MLKPEENESGYKNSTCLNKIDSNSFSFTKLMLIHGTGDDNVHPIHSLHLMTKLQNAGVVFDSYFYKDLNHGFIRDYSGNSTLQLFKTMQKQIDSKIQK